jgi:DNA-binding response OmpR family regulator
MKIILVIEDEPMVLENVLDLLELEGFISIGANNGAIGLQHARAYQPDLILCDINMPQLDGYGVLSILRQDATTAGIPFIFFSAMTDAADYQRGMELGANDYLAKPFTTDELLSAISKHL